MKVMAMEGHYDSHPNGAPLILFGIPNAKEKRIDYALEIPKLSSLILKHDLNAPLAGLDSVADDLEPPVSIVFWSFRIMVGLGFAMLGLGCSAFSPACAESSMTGQFCIVSPLCSVLPASSL